MVEQRQHNGRPTDWVAITAQGLKALQLYAQLLEVRQRRKA
jgi:hypothetical protein